MSDNKRPSTPTASIPPSLFAKSNIKNLLNKVTTLKKEPLTSCSTSELIRNIIVKFNLYTLPPELILRMSRNIYLSGSNYFLTFHQY